MPRLRNFTIDEEYLTDVTIVKEGNSYTDNGREPNGEPYGWYKRRGTKDTKFKGRKV